MIHCPSCGYVIKPYQPKSETMRAAIDRCHAGEKPAAVAHDLRLGEANLYRALKKIRMQANPCVQTELD